MAKRRLHWMQVNTKRWESVEMYEGVPDWTIDKIDNLTYRCKGRTGRKATVFGSLQEAKAHAEASW